MKKVSFPLAMVVVLLMLTLVGTAMAQGCAQAFGGENEDKLKQDIETCAQEVRNTMDAFFTATLTYEPCNIAMTISHVWGPNHCPDEKAFKLCIEKNGWKISISCPE